MLIHAVVETIFGPVFVLPASSKNLPAVPSPQETRGILSEKTSTGKGRRLFKLLFSACAHLFATKFSGLLRGQSVRQ
jgi:hypothetical protein